MPEEQEEAPPEAARGGHDRVVKEVVYELTLQGRGSCPRGGFVDPVRFQFQGVAPAMCQEVSKSVEDSKEVIFLLVKVSTVTAARPQS